MVKIGIPNYNFSFNISQKTFNTGIEGLTSHKKNDTEFLGRSMNELSSYDHSMFIRTLKIFTEEADFK